MNMNIEKIDALQKEIDKTEYWDVKILDFQIDYFGDEVNMVVYNDADTSWKISFLYRVDKISNISLM